MPEGDAVYRACRRLNQALPGHVLVRAELRVPQAASASRSLVGQTVLEVVPRGKHQLTRFSGGLTLHTHLRMDGVWRIVDAGARLPGPAFEIRVLLGTASTTAVGLRLGEVDLVATRDESRVVGHLGPDLLGPDWDADEAIRRLARDPGRSIGEALLDQRNLAGIGTIYRAESLFRARVHPRTPVADVDLPRVVESAHALLHAAITGPPHTTTGSVRRGEERWVFERPGRPCRRCGTAIEVEAFGPAGQERPSYWCPRCQPRNS